MFDRNKVLLILTENEFLNETRKEWFCWKI